MELNILLKETLADTFSFYLKVHGAHWNIEGPDFVQYHEFLGNLYEEVHGAVDLIAELIRTLDVKVSGTFEDLKSNVIFITNNTNDYRQVFAELRDDNEVLILKLFQTYKAAEEAGEIGISNALQDRIQVHQKHGWMLKAILK